MGSYVQGSLLPGERVIYETHLHWIIFFWGCVFAVLALVTYGITLIVAVPLLVRALIIRQTSEFAVTNKRVIIKTGWLSRRTIEMMMSKVESVDVLQEILGRMLGYGKITVVGTGSTKEAFRYIANPLEFRRAVQSQQT